MGDALLGPIKRILSNTGRKYLIAYDKSSRRFTTTDSGYQFFKLYDELIELTEPIATISERTQEDNTWQYANLGGNPIDGFL
jgi:hypothetical protein